VARAPDDPPLLSPQLRPSTPRHSFLPPLPLLYVVAASTPPSDLTRPPSTLDLAGIELGEGVGGRGRLHLLVCGGSSSRQGMPLPPLRHYPSSSLPPIFAPLLSV
jgi:hypothetical protein